MAGAVVTGAGRSREAWQRVGLEPSLGGLWGLSRRTTRSRDTYGALPGNA